MSLTLLRSRIASTAGRSLRPYLIRPTILAPPRRRYASIPSSPLPSTSSLPPSTTTSSNNNNNNDNKNKNEENKENEENDENKKQGYLESAVYIIAVIVIGETLQYYFTDTRSAIQRYVVPGLLRTLVPDAEDAHHYATAILGTLRKLDMNPRERVKSSPALRTEVFDTVVSNPVAISAGLDKDAEIPDALFDLGAGIVEVGGCTPLPQEGNPRPRVFRVPGVEGMVNRYGLNSQGADAMARRLRERVRMYARMNGVKEDDVLNGETPKVVPPGSLRKGRLLAVQIAKNKDTDGADEAAVAQDHVYCVQRLGKFADILVVNVSSPNTPGLRDLQAAGPLTRLLSAVVDEAGRTERRTKPKVMVKVSPDEDDDEQVQGIVRAVYDSGVDGVIVGNTTKRRAGLQPRTVRDRMALAEEGGFSGPAMFGRTLSLVEKYNKQLKAAGMSQGGDAAKTIFATGGITNGEQALQVLNAGASVAMIYTSMTYGGAGTVTRIKEEMRKQITDRS
ncbi:hypothetical protein N3K66_007738 [Trichothecium roseum]|uniref:Uncharacterized protein n=1 Tax=Trichothecium roseum TaxID=47278 RepID=A0ACC0UWI2_9HYPO|nr:hypothetical protein N3K66_007738 [Trichothecium roseum]